MAKAKLKKIERAELKPGLKVVVNELTDTYLYTVKTVSDDGLRAELVYYSEAQEISAGIMDYSGLYHPSPEQKKMLCNTWEERYQRYLETCERARSGPLAFDEWKAWHQG